MSLADELLADLDEIDNDDLEEELSEVKDEPAEIEEDDAQKSIYEPMDVEIPVSIKPPKSLESLRYFPFLLRTGETMTSKRKQLIFWNRLGASRIWKYRYFCIGIDLSVLRRCSDVISAFSNYFIDSVTRIESSLISSEPELVYDSVFQVQWIMIRSKFLFVALNLC